MPRRTVLTNRQRASLFDLPSDEAVLVEHYVLSAEDLAHVRRRRRPQNRLGFALQLCAFRYPGRLIQPGEVIPEAMLSFIGGQLDVTSTTLLDYGAREATRYQHSAALQRIYGYLPFEGGVREEIRTWLIKAAESSRSAPMTTSPLPCWRSCGAVKSLPRRRAPSSVCVPMPWSLLNVASPLASPHGSTRLCASV